MRAIALLFTLHCSLFTSFAQHTAQKIDFGWQFRMLTSEGQAPGATEWRTVDLPHDFQIEQPWIAPDASERPDNTDVAANIKSRLSSRGFKEMGKGEYRYRFTPSEAWKDQRVLLDFGGIMYTADVYLNDQLIGGTDYGYVGFEIDLTGKLRFGETNELRVIADTREPNNSRWYTGGGLFRSVQIVTTPRDLYFGRHPLYITTRNNRFVTLSAEYTDRTLSKEHPQTLMRVTIYDAEGQVVAQTEATKGRNPQTRTQEMQAPELTISSPHVWDLDTPYLYKAVAQLIRPDGSVADEVSERFGLRTVEYGPSFGMKLNGHKVLLKGYANHHTLGALGAAAYPKAIEKRLRLMKSFGLNHIRTSHNPYSREFIELCDELGILLVDELYDKWTRQHTGGRVPFEYHWQQDVPEWVKRDRNSPSVVMWSLGNELQQDPNQPFNDWGVTMFKLQKTLLQRYDSTRLVTVAMHPRYRNWQTDSLPADLAMITDVQAYNYRYMYFPGDGRRFPWMRFYQSEASMAAMGPNFFEMDLSRVIGLAYWGAIDYLGESQGWPDKGWSQGGFDISLEPKPKAYLMKSIFKPEEPVVHLAVIESKNDVMWNGIQTGNDGMSDHWNRQAGQRLSLIAYTNADEVELRINGKTIGTKPNPKADPKQRNQIRWEDVPFAEGYAEAIARTGGKVVARHRVETAGPAVRLMLTPEDASWQADGYDLQHIRVTAVDKKGRRVPMAQDNLQFQLLEGDARIVAVTNGDIRSEELNVQDHRRLWNGSAMVILRAGRQPSQVTLRATSVNNPAIRATIRVSTCK